jgi:hypothetical protein
MNDELDPRLAQWFAAAERDLPAAAFMPQFESLRQRPRPLETAGRIALLIAHGLGAAARPLLQLRLEFAGCIAAAAVMLIIGLAMHG